MTVQNENISVSCNLICFSLIARQQKNYSQQRKQSVSRFFLPFVLRYIFFAHFSQPHISPCLAFYILYSKCNSFRKQQVNYYVKAWSKALFSTGDVLRVAKTDEKLNESEMTRAHVLEWVSSFFGRTQIAKLNSPVFLWMAGKLRRYTYTISSRRVVFAQTMIQLIKLSLRFSRW